ncbi:MAG: DUF1853 family protein [Pricia sp.]
MFLGKLNGFQNCRPAFAVTRIYSRNFVCIMSRDFVKEQCLGFLNTNPLWVNEQFGIRQFEFPKVDASRFRPEPISEKIRLGHQMEQVFQQLIGYSDGYDILIHNQPIKKGNRTIGEIDFVLRERESGQLLHIELTYKFYIVNPDITEPVHRLMGPNKRDMFFTKMEKIKNRQFPLLHSVEGSKLLHENGIDPQKVEHQCCFKAQLFGPFEADSVSIRPLNKSCISGFWLRFEDFDREEFRGYTYYIAYKPEWVVAPHEDVPWQSHFAIMMELNLRMLKENAPMVWMRRSDTEFQKFFVVWW